MAMATHEINVEVEAEHVGIIIGITPNSDRELGYTVSDVGDRIDLGKGLTLGDLLGQLDGLGNLVSVGLDGTLDGSIGICPT